MKNLSHKSGLRMRDDVQTNQLKCLDMEAKIARQAQQQQQLEEQVKTEKHRETDGGAHSIEELPPCILDAIIADDDGLCVCIAAGGRQT